MAESIQIHNAEQIQEQILKAGFKMNVEAKVYFDAMKDAETTAYLFGYTPEEGLQVQVLYFFDNCKAKTPEQKEIKKRLLEWAGHYGYRG